MTIFFQTDEGKLQSIGPDTFITTEQWGALTIGGGIRHQVVAYGQYHSYTSCGEVTSERSKTILCTATTEEAMNAAIEVIADLLSTGTTFIRMTDVLGRASTVHDTTIDVIVEQVLERPRDTEAFAVTVIDAHDAYRSALDRREHGGVAAGKLVDAVAGAIRDLGPEPEPFIDCAACQTGTNCISHPGPDRSRWPTTTPGSTKEST